jgi:hypothetical protein
MQFNELNILNTINIRTHEALLAERADRLQRKFPAFALDTEDSFAAEKVLADEFAIRGFLPLRASVDRELAKVGIVDDHIEFLRAVENAARFTVFQRAFPFIRFPMAHEEPDEVVAPVHEHPRPSPALLGFEPIVEVFFQCREYRWGRAADLRQLLAQ